MHNTIKCGRCGDVKYQGESMPSITLPVCDRCVSPWTTTDERQTTIMAARRATDNNVHLVLRSAEGNSIAAVLTPTMQRSLAATLLAREGAEQEDGDGS